MAVPEHQRPLEYATPRPRKRRVHRVYMLIAMTCFALTVTSWIVAGHHGGVMLPMPDPPPASDPYWKQRQQDERWFFAGCCTMPVFGTLGLFFLYGAFAAGP